MTGAACHGLLEQLVLCLRKSPCMKDEGKTVRECIGKAEECAPLRYSYFECKRQQADARSRIQGNKVDR
eukprot:jgi/Botrbrau1/22377/Bobra.0002s0054.1